MIAISKNKKQIFGAFTDISYSSETGWKAGNSKSFLFIYQQNKFIKLKCLNTEKEVYHRGDIICYFEDNGDLYLCNDCNIIKNSFHNWDAIILINALQDFEPNSLEAR